MTETTITSNHAMSGRLTLEELENSTGTLPVLGYSVQWNLAHVEISHFELIKALGVRGFSEVIPQRPSPTTALRRALVKWLQNRAATGGALPDYLAEFELEDEDDFGELTSSEAQTETKKGKSHTRKSLIRKVNNPHSDWLVFGLVIEHLDLARLGLSYATQLRVFLHKKTNVIRVSQTQAGLEEAEPSDHNGGDDTTGGDQDSTNLATIGREIDQLFQHYHQHHQARDISILLRQIVSGLDSFSLRRLGGVYFVPQSHRPALEEVRKLVDGLPATAGYTSDKFMLMLPILDGAGAKKQLAGAAHRDFMQELKTMQTDLAKLISDSEEHRIRPETVARRLTSYRELKVRSEVYAELLDMQQGKILTLLEQMTWQATRLLDGLAIEVAGQNQGEQSAFDWDNIAVPVESHLPKGLDGNDKLAAD